MKRNQSGFVLMVVLVAVLIVSAMAMLIFNQTSTDTKAAWVSEQQSQLSIQAWQAITPLWQLNHAQMQTLAGYSGSWLERLLHTPSQPITGWYACGQLNTGTLGTSDGQSDQGGGRCSGNLLKYHAYLSVLDDTNALYKMLQPAISTQMDAQAESPADAQQMDERYYLLKLYAVTTSQAQPSCQGLSMYELQSLKCYGELGITAQAVAANWLIVIRQSSDVGVIHAQNTQASKMHKQIKFIKLGVHDVEIVRE